MGAAIDTCFVCGRKVETSDEGACAACTARRDYGQQGSVLVELLAGDPFFVEELEETGEIGIWTNDDIIGSGFTIEAALDDAIVTASSWKEAT